MYYFPMTGMDRMFFFAFSRRQTSVFFFIIFLFVSTFFLFSVFFFFVNETLGTRFGKNGRQCRGAGGFHRDVEMRARRKTTNKRNVRSCPRRIE